MSFNAHYRILACVIFFHMPHPVTLIPNSQVDVLSSKNQALHSYICTVRPMQEVSLRLQYKLLKFC